MEFFTINELTKSSTAEQKKINNTPSAEHEKNLIALIKNILDPLRKEYGKPIIVTSGYRSNVLNKAIGGAKNSQHQYGFAADIRSVSDSKEENKKIFELAKNLPFDQLIDEHNYDWIHISYSPKHRRQILHL